MLRRLLARIVDLRDEEIPAALTSFVYFFFLLAGYYILRPIRDEMGIARGADKLPWLFSGTFVAMLAMVPLYGIVCSRFPRRRIVPVVYRFFALNLLVFFALLRLGVSKTILGPAFFIWTSVYNLFVVSMFWSVMADLWKSEESKRLFGFIAAGGSAGALAGPALTGLLIKSLGAGKLLFVSALFLEISALCAGRLFRRRGRIEARAPSDERMGGGIYAGITQIFRSPYLSALCARTLLLTTTATFLYFQQARIVEAAAEDAAGRTQIFAAIDFTVNVVSILVQALITGRLLKRLGLAFSLGLLPVLSCGGFVAIALAPGVVLIALVQGMRRALHYAVDRPSREVLFTVIEPEAKYKAKSFIDTVVYRGGDALSGWGYQGLVSAGLGVAGTALVAVPVTGAWLAVSILLARKQALAAHPKNAPEISSPRAAGIT